MNWSLAYEENFKCKDMEIHNVDDIKNAGFEIIENATVPGNVEIDFMKNGKLPDIYFSTNTLLAQKLENMHFWYFTEIDIEDIDSYIRFEGIDTIADIYVNGNLAQSCDNMCTAYDVYSNFNKGKNEIVVHIKPVCIEARQYNPPAGSMSQKYNMETLYIRKAAHMFGWDIMPRIVSAGIWKPVTVKKIKEDAIEEVYLTAFSVDTEKNVADMFFAMHTTLSGDFATDYSIRLRGECGDSSFDMEKVLWHSDTRFKFNLENPKLWWPKNYGEPNLYNVTVELKYKGEIVDTYKFTTGVKTVSLLNEEMIDENNKGEFCFVVNGQKVFALGTNWVPLDALHSNDADRLDAAMDMLEDIGCNMVRCWGGNVYESDRFYELCNKMGIMVWQDFGMGCAVHPMDLEYKLKQEAIYQVKRLRNNPCIMLWAGDNECDLSYSWNGFRRNPNQNRLTRVVLKTVVDEHGFTVPYLPSSPFMSEKAFSLNLPLQEDHLWGPRDYFKGDFYKNSICHFASETGYHGFPSVKSLKKFLANPEKIFNEDGTATDEYLVHAASMDTDPTSPYAYRIRLAYTQVETLFGKAADDLDNFVKQSQISQAEAKKYFIEKFRVSKGYRTGILWWNLVDGWPQVSDAIVDYYYSKKLAYHYIKRSQEPVCLMFDEPANGKIALVGVNEYLSDSKVSYTVTDVENDKIVLKGESDIKADCATVIDELEIAPDEKKFYLISWIKDGVEYKNHYFTNILDIDYGKYMECICKCNMDEFDL